MRMDHISTFNTNLEQQATYCDQMVAFHENEIAKLKTLARVLRSAASTEPADGDPSIDLKPFILPSVLTRRPGVPPSEYLRSPAGTPTQNQSGVAAVAQALEPEKVS